MNTQDYTNPMSYDYFKKPMADTRMSKHPRIDVSVNNEGMPE